MDLSTLGPLIALPSSPGNVVPVAEVAGRENLVEIKNQTKKETYSMRHGMSQRQIEMVLEGSLINVVRRRQ